MRMTTAERSARHRARDVAAYRKKKREYRGLLCMTCNTYLGWFESNKQEVMAYLLATAETVQ